MTTLRNALAGITVLLLLAGYGLSQVAALTGTAAEHAARMDRPGVATVASLLLIAMVVFACIPDREAERE